MVQKNPLQGFRILKMELIMSDFKLAWKAFWAILKDKAKADAWRVLESGGQGAAQEPAAEAGTGVEGGCDAMLLLSVLQREARLVDYIQEELSGYDDASVGVVSRKVHDDCRRCLGKYMGIVPVLEEAELSRMEVPAGFDPRRIRLTGRVLGEPPYSGTVQHRGWRAEWASLPRRSGGPQDSSVICPAEVEI